MVSGGFELHAEAPADEVGRKAHERHERHTDEDEKSAFASSFRLPGVGLKWPELQMRSASSMFLKVPAYDDDGIDHESQTPPEQGGRPAARSRRATSAATTLGLFWFTFDTCSVWQPPAPHNNPSLSPATDHAALIDPCCPRQC